MRDTDLFKLALGVDDPWYVKSIDFEEKEKRIDIHIDFKKGDHFTCPKCKNECSVHDTVQKTWRHLSFFQYEAFIHARVPRTKCKTHNVLLVKTPWARNDSGFTLLFEAMAMILVKEMPVLAVARILNVSDKKLWRLLIYYVNKGIERQNLSDIDMIGVDETASKRGHNYVSTFVDLKIRKVVFATKGKDNSVFKRFKTHLIKKKGFPEHISDISCDMSSAFIKGAKENFPNAQITFDRFHIMKIINNAVDQVRREEQVNNPFLKNSRYFWLKNPENVGKKGIAFFRDLNDENLKTAKAYQMKLSFRNIFSQDTKNGIDNILEWIQFALDSGIKPMQDAARTIRSHFGGIIRWFESQINNAVLEGLNSVIQAAKSKAKGYKNTNYFIAIIYLIGGNLDFKLPT